MVIKGYSKSAGYQPGVKFEDNRFRNSWNAVYVAGAWRFVQCNWGARHLVNAKEVPKPGRAKSDSLRYVSMPALNCEKNSHFIFNLHDVYYTFLS